jgi:TetR/AcrR family transcriptional regulator, transcriptional repressor for nem operon
MDIEHRSTSDSFLEHLKCRLAARTSLPKRERTRERLRIAAVEALNERGYEDMRALSITEQAGLSEGLFYVYFKNKVDITLDILREFHYEFLKLDRFSGAHSSPFEVIQAANRRWIAVAVANSGLMRCVFQAGNEVPEFSKLLSNINNSLYLRVFDSVQRRKPSISQTAMMMSLYMLGGMMDEIVRKLVVYPDLQLLKIIAETGSDENAVADAASVIWYRVLYLDDEIPVSISKQSLWLAGHI